MLFIPCFYTKYRDDDPFSRWLCFQYSHTGDTDGDSSVFTYWRCRWWWFRWWCADEASVPSKVRTLLRQAWCGLEIPSLKGGVVMLQWDSIILGHMSRSDPETSVFENEEGLYHPGTYVYKWSGELHRECGRIVSSLNFGSERIQWLRYSRTCVEPVIPRGRIVWVPQMCWSRNSERKDH